MRRASVHPESLPLTRYFLRGLRLSLAAFDRLHYFSDILGVIGDANVLIRLRCGRWAVYETVAPHAECPLELRGAETAPMHARLLATMMCIEAVIRHLAEPGGIEAPVLRHVLDVDLSELAEDVSTQPQ